MCWRLKPRWPNEGDKMKKNEVPEPFVPHTPIEKLVHAGDNAGLIDHLATLTEAQRVAERPGAHKLYKMMNESALWVRPQQSAWRKVPTMQQQNAVHTVVHVCGSLEDAVEDWQGFFHHRSSLVALWQRIPRPDIQEYADRVIERTPNALPVLHALFKAGMIARPMQDNYVLALLTLSVARPTPVELSRFGAGYEIPLSIQELIEEDPEFAGATLLRLFELEGNSDLSLSNCDKYGKGLSSPRNTMQGLFLGLLEQGVLSRPLLLDKTLDALERDWLQYRSGWFSRFHEALAPSVDELRIHRDRYLSLCHSRIPPTVTLALDALQTLQKQEALPGEQLLVALTPVMTYKTKAQIVTALKLLDSMVLADPSAAAAAARVAAGALICDASDVQKQAIQRLQRWGVNEEVSSLLRPVLPMVAATHRETVQALLTDGGDAGQRNHAQAGAAIAASLPEARAPLSPLDPSRRLVVIETAEDLIDGVAYSLEHSTDVDAFERVVEALVRMAANVAADASRYGAVLKRARKLCANADPFRSTAKPLSRELSRLLIAVLTQLRTAPLFSFAKGRVDCGAFLCHRIDELMEFASRGSGLPPLAAPTHQLGYIDPAVLVERVAAEQAQGIESPRQEQVLSLLRLVPGRDQTVLAKARKLDPTPYVLALRYALGDDVEIGKEARLFVAAARIRHPQQDDPALVLRYGDCGPDTCRHAQYRFRVAVSEHGWTYGHVDATPAAKVSDPDFLASLRHMAGSDDDRLWFHAHFGGEDEGLVLMAASIVPSDSAAFFAEGVRRLSNNLDWSAAEWHNRGYLAILLDPTVGCSDMATLCLACGLAGKEPGQTALAVDAMLAAWLEARLDASSLALTMRDGVTSNIFKAARLHKSLSNAARTHESAPWLVFQVLCDLVCLDASDLPKDTSALLDLLLEVRLLTGQYLPEVSRQHIAAMRLSGKGKAAQKELLGLGDQDNQAVQRGR
jgi:hypothetical protein